MVLDQAHVDVINLTNETVYFYRQFVNCFECPLINQERVDANSNRTIPLQTYSNQHYVISKVNRPYWIDGNDEDDNCNLCQSNCSSVDYLYLYDQSRYQLKIFSNVFNDSSEDNNQSRRCSLELIESGRNNFWSFLLVLLLYCVSIALLYFAYQFIRTRAVLLSTRRPNSRQSHDIPNDASVNIASRSPSPMGITIASSNRINSIDSFRGITILLMIFVNYGAGQYKQLQHVAWDGFHLADIVFPFFIFIMGLTIAVGFKNLTGRSNFSLWQLLAKILRRSLTLFLLGIIINSIGSADFSTIRIPGVLQRFAISYGLVATIHVLSLTILQNPRTVPTLVRKLSLYNLLWPQYLLVIVMLFLYFYFTLFWNYDSNCPIGYVGPGGLSQNMSHLNCVGGAAHKIDELLFSSSHCYRNYFASTIYDPGHRFGLWHDPEGVLGTTNSIILTIIGLQTGYALIVNPDPFARITRWLSYFFALVSLTFLSVFCFQIPINKNLWSFSFVTFTGALAVGSFTLCYYLIDLRRYWPIGWPFHYAGQNSILLYMGHEICSEMFPFTFAVSDSSHVGYLARNLIGTTIWFWISVVLAKHELFLTI